MATHSATKSGLLFDAINASQGFYRIPVSIGFRSRVNIPIRVYDANGPCVDLEKKFIKEAKDAKIIHINGHRSVGGLRASLYNAVSVKDTRILIAFMTKFMAENNIEL